MRAHACPEAVPIQRAGGRRSSNGHGNRDKDLHHHQNQSHQVVYDDFALGCVAIKCHANCGLVEAHVHALPLVPVQAAGKCMQLILSQLISLRGDEVLDAVLILAAPHLAHHHVEPNSWGRGRSNLVHPGLTQNLPSMPLRRSGPTPPKQTPTRCAAFITRTQSLIRVCISRRMVKFRCGCSLLFSGVARATPRSHPDFYFFIFGKVSRPWRWSCSSDGTLTITTLSVRMPDHHGDYVRSRRADGDRAYI